MVDTGAIVLFLENFEQTLNILFRHLIGDFSENFSFLGIDEEPVFLEGFQEFLRRVFIFHIFGFTIRVIIS